MGLPAGERQATEADQRLGRQGGRPGMAWRRMVAPALQPGWPGAGIGGEWQRRCRHRSRAGQGAGRVGGGPTALARSEQRTVQVVNPAMEHQGLGGRQAAPVLRANQGEGAPTLLRAGPQLRQRRQQPLELNLGLAEPGPEIHHCQGQIRRGRLEGLKGVTPPELLGPGQIHAGDRAVTANQ